jgi:predicted nucleic-acid-binding protein
MKPTVLDTNVILRYLLKDNAQLYEQALTLISPVKNGTAKAHILEGVLVECVYVLLKVYAVSRPEIVSALTGLLNYPRIVNSDKERQKQSLILFRDCNVDIVDALIHVTATENDWDIASFDRDLRKLDRQT